MFVSTLSLSAQTPKDSAYLQVTYLEDYVSTLGTKNFDELVLNVGKTSSMFFSKYEDRKLSVKDSIFSHGGGLYDYRALVGELLSGQSYHVYKNVPQGRLSYSDIFIEAFFYEEQFEKPVWELVGEKKQIQGYSCSKAITKFRGRTWTVWYTNEIPIPEGPWKLCGLSGLILDAIDAESLYHFYCVGIKQLSTKIPIQIRKQMYRKCLKADFYKSGKECWGDPELFLNKIHGVTSIVVTNPDGKVIKIPSYKFIDMEKYE